MVKHESFRPPFTKGGGVQGQSPWPGLGGSPTSLRKKFIASGARQMQSQPPTPETGTNLPQLVIAVDNKNRCAVDKSKTLQNIL